jgi:ABC-type Fe3+ transport system permease subunit
MRYDHEKEQQLAALEAELARHARRDGMTLAVIAALAVTVLAVLLAYLSDLVEVADLRR